MSYTDPRTWSTGELVTATLMNTHVRDNLDAIKEPPTDSYLFNEGADYTTTSTSFADVDATDLSMDITTTGGAILVTASLTLEHSSTGPTYFDVTLDGTRQALDDGAIAVGTSTAGRPLAVTLVFWILAPSAAAHQIRLQWKVANGTGTMYAGAGTATKDIHPQMVVREVS